MGRIRSIKPEFFLDDELAALDPLDRLTFVGLWCQADREGRMEDRPKRLATQILPYDGKNFEDRLQRLADHGFIIRYEDANSRRFIQIRTWEQHQRPHHTEHKSVIPPPQNGVLTVKQPLDNGEITVSSPLLNAQEGRGEREGEGRGEGGGEGRGNEYKANKKEHLKAYTSPYSPPSAAEAAVMEKWNQRASGRVKSITKLSGPRLAKLRKRIKEDEDFVQKFEHILDKLYTSDFLTGKKKDGNFVASFDWLLCCAEKGHGTPFWILILEGKYDNKPLDPNSAQNREWDITTYRE